PRRLGAGRGPLLSGRGGRGEQLIDPGSEGPYGKRGGLAPHTGGADLPVIVHAPAVAGAEPGYEVARRGVLAVVQSPKAGAAVGLCVMPRQVAAELAERVPLARCRVEVEVEAAVGQVGRVPGRDVEVLRQLEEDGAVRREVADGGDQPLRLLVALLVS